MSSYIFKLNLLDRQIEKICGKTASVQADIKNEVNKQKQLIQEINSIFERFDNQKTLFLQSFDEKKTNVEKDAFFQDFVMMCPIDSTLLIELKSKLTNIEQENTQLSEQIIDLQSEIDALEKLSEEQNSLSETIKKETHQEDLDLMLKEQSLETELSFLKETFENLQKENKKRQIELFVLQQKISDQIEENSKTSIQLAKKKTSQQNEIEEQTRKEQKYNKQLKELENQEKEIDCEILKKKDELMKIETKNQQLEFDVENRLVDLKTCEDDHIKLIDEQKKIRQEKIETTQKSEQILLNLSKNE